MATESKSMDVDVLHGCGEELNSTRKRDVTPTCSKKICVDLCEVCEKLVSKYKCPRCGLVSCSLACVKHHKETGECSGKRNKTVYVPLKQFTDSHLMSDYYFLEDIDRSVNASVRTRSNITGANVKCRRKVQGLKMEAKRRGIFFFFLSHGMEKREQNTTFFNKRKKKIFWKVKLVFPESEAEFVEESVCEDDTLSALLTKYLHPLEGSPWLRYRLKRYVSPSSEDVFGDLEVLLKAERVKGSSSRYYHLDPTNSITANLRHKTVVEFPEFHIISKANFNQYSIISGDKKRSRNVQSCKHDDTEEFDKQEQHPGVVVDGHGPLSREEDEQMRLDLTTTDVMPPSVAVNRTTICKEMNLGLLVPYSDSEPEEGEVFSD